MLPTKLGADAPEAERARYRIIRRDWMIEVPGLILAADTDAGTCKLRDATGAETDHAFGPDGLRIVAR